MAAAQRWSRGGEWCRRRVYSDCSLASGGLYGGGLPSHLVVVDPSHDDAVDLEGFEPFVNRRVDRAQDQLEAVAPRELDEALRVERVEG